MATAVALPGVRAVLTGADVAADGVGGMPVGWGITQPDGSPMAEPPWPIIAHDTVRFAGELVAVVIASTRSEALDGAEAVSVDYAELPVVATTATAADEGTAKSGHKRLTTPALTGRLANSVQHKRRSTTRRT